MKTMKDGIRTWILKSTRENERGESGGRRERRRILLTEKAAWKGKNGHSLRNARAYLPCTFDACNWENQVEAGSLSNQRILWKYLSPSYEQLKIRHAPRSPGSTIGHLKHRIVHSIQLAVHALDSSWWPLNRTVQHRSLRLSSRFHLSLFTGNLRNGSPLFSSSLDSVRCHSHTESVVKTRNASYSRSGRLCDVESPLHCSFISLCDP